jgi:hypothetical protein
MILWLEPSIFVSNAIILGDVSVMVPLQLNVTVPPPAKAVSRLDSLHVETTPPASTVELKSAINAIEVSNAETIDLNKKPRKLIIFASPDFAFRATYHGMENQGKSLEWKKIETHRLQLTMDIGYADPNLDYLARNASALSVSTLCGTLSLPDMLEYSLPRPKVSICLIEMIQKVGLTEFVPVQRYNKC